MNQTKPIYKNDEEKDAIPPIIIAVAAIGLGILVIAALAEGAK